jgi:hypothetical protein
MRAEMLARLRETMRGGTAQNSFGTVGTSELGSVPTPVPTKFQQKFQQRGEKSANKINEVPTVPTVPTQSCRGRSERDKTASLGVGTGVGTALGRGAVTGPEVHRCGCGSVGFIGVGWFLKEPSRARWYCSACYAAEAIGNE